MDCCPWRPLLVSVALHFLVFLTVIDRQSPMAVVVPSGGIKAVISTTANVTAIPFRAAEDRRPLALPAKKTAKINGAGSPPRIWLDAASAPSAGPRGVANVPAMPHVGIALSKTEAPPVAPDEPRNSLGADDLRQYRLDLAREAKRFRRYPPLARERGWEGTTEVVVTIDGAERSPRVHLSRSSGFALLDEQALEMIDQAAPLVSLPGSLRGRSLVIPIPVRFSVND